MSQFFIRSLLVCLLMIGLVGCGTAEPEVIVDKETAADLQAQRDAQDEAEYKADAAAFKADPNLSQ